MDKTLKKLFLTVVAVVLAWCAAANPVEINRARSVGSAFLSAMGHGGEVVLDVVKTPYEGIYVFNADGGGFVLVAADDCVRPILGYSLNGTFKVADMPANLDAWLAHCSSEIERLGKDAADVKGAAGSHGGATDVLAAEWARLAAGAAPEPALTTAVAPLVSTTWNQSPYYNDLCPYDTVYGQLAVAGCVATATAQVMKYWNHPATGYGSHSYVASNSHISYGVLSADFGNTTYQWDSMPNALSAASSQTQVSAVATLIYHVGVAIEMKYNVSSQGGSSSYNHSYYYPSAMSALVDYFKYAPDIVVVVPGSYDVATYSAMLRAELDQSRPILYDGRDESGGHSFVCDGYDANNMFHFNWGWGGYCDGYYAIGALNPAPGGTGGNATYTFNMSNSAMLGIRPNASFGNGGTVTVASTGGDSTCNVTGGGTFAFGDTVNIRATAGEGYRFAGWSDNSQDNPRIFTMTGGNYSFTARFQSIGSDTMSFCGDMGYYVAWGEYQQGFDKYWGIKLPASALTPGRTLKAVDLYVGEYYGGMFDLMVYSGTTAPTDTVYSTSVWIDYNDRNDWFSFYLPTPYTVEVGKNIWIIFHNSDILFPATCTHSCGNPDGFLYGPTFAPDPEWNLYSFMIRGRFVDSGVHADGDTVSYCGDKRYYTSWGAKEWGIMLPAADLAGRNYLKSVKLYADFLGVYELRVYRGGSDHPGTLVHTQPADIVSYGWHEILLDNTIAIGAGDSLWITFSCPELTWPASSCRYTGNPNSNWMTWGDGTWWHLNEYYNSADYSWMIKAVTSATAPALPPPTVAIVGDTYVGIANPVMFIARHSVGTTPTWTVQSGTPATATGDTVFITWNQSGWYQVTAAVGNANGSCGDTLWVNVIDCDEAITQYPYTMSFEEHDNMVCWSTADIDGDGDGWRQRDYNGYESQRSYYSIGSIWTGDSMQAVAMDNWLFTPKFATRNFGDDGSYTLQWYDFADWNNTVHAHYGVYIDTTASTSIANYVLLAEYNVENEWYEPRAIDLTPYAGKTFRLAFRHYNNGGLSTLYIDRVSVFENVRFFREGDTISYCGWRIRENQLGYNTSIMRWGVKFPAERLAGYDTLKSVLLYVVEDADYMLRVSQGGDNAPGSLVRSQTVSFAEQYGWQEFVLDPAIVIDSTLPMWVTFVSNGHYPATYAMSCGDTNSDWFSGNGTTWVHANDYNFAASWMIKAVVAAYDEGGHLGVEDMLADDSRSVYGVAGGIVVKGGRGEDVTVYDMMGRTAVTARLSDTACRMPLATGVYMVKIGDRPTCKVVVLR